MMNEKDEIKEFLDWWGMRCEYEDLDVEQIKTLQDTLAYSKFCLVKAWQELKSELMKTKIGKVLLKTE